jgi:hypothetical protein
MSGELRTCALWAGIALAGSWFAADGVRAQQEEINADQAAADESAEEPATAPNEAAPTAPVEAPGAAASVAFQPYAGVGWSSRSFQRPTSMGKQVMPNAFVPALEVGLRLFAWPEADFGLTFELNYQTGLGLVVHEAPPFAAVNDVPVRSEHVQLSIAPSWRLGPVRLNIPLGAAMRTLWPGIHTSMTPGYSLFGPFARLELLVPILSQLVLRLGPELQWIVSIDQLIKQEGVNSHGFAVGGEGDLSFAFTPNWALGLHYRESHALVGSNSSVSFTDVERYMTLRILGTY